MTHSLRSYARTAAILFAAVACVGRAPASRDIASTHEVPLTSLRMVPIAGVPDERRALFVNITPDERRFSITECLSPTSKAGELAMDSAECSTLIDKWVPLQESQFRARFGDAFQNAVGERSKRLGWRYDQEPFVLNLIGSILGGFTVYGYVAEVVLKDAIIGGPTARIRFAVKVVSFALTVAAFQAAQHGLNPSIRYYDLTQETAKKSFRNDQAGIPKTTPEKYAATRASLIEALGAQILL